MNRYQLDPILESMEEDPEGEWVRWEDVKATLGRFAGPRCVLCGNLCVDAAKDESGYCPDCAELAGDIESSGHHPYNGT